MKIGVIYYPEHWDRNMWETDADLMVETGVKIVRLAEFAWCRLEPSEGNYTFDWLDDAIQIFADRNIEVILGTPTNCPPLWLYERYPDAIQCDENGNRIPIGVRSHRCYNSPSMIKHTKRIVEEMAKHYSQNPAISSWQIDNELDANHCTCDSCTEKFRNWLKEKYNTLDKVNETYGNIMWSGEYSSWSQIVPPHGNRQTWLNPSYMLDYYRYASDSMVEYVRFQADIIRSHCKDVTITTNTWLCDQMPDFYDTFRDLDYVSYDNYPVTVLPKDKEEIHSHAFHLDLMRGVKRKNFCIMEQLSGAPGCWMPMLRTPRPNMVKGYSLQAMARGADSILHFRWRSATKGAEMYWHGILDHNNKLGRRYQELKDLCHTVNHSLRVMEGTTIRNRVAILYSSDQEYALKIQTQVENFHYYSQLKLFHNAIIRLGVGVDIINWTEDLTNYDIVIAPTLYVTKQLVTDNLIEYARKGGKLILTNRSGVKDETNACIMDYLPGPFSECVGAVVEEYDPIGNDTHTITTVNGKTYQCSMWCDILQTTTANVLATYQEDYYAGKPAVTVNSYGEGQVYYIGTVLERDFYLDLLKGIIGEIGIDYFDNLPDGVEVSIRENEEEKYILIFNNTNEVQTIPLNGSFLSLLREGKRISEITLHPFEMDMVKR
ncbi:MAG TPA: beta-galactosidase [Lachnospiraceae bacterium]|nr:beta-galactosidase [Lachnospiraceae bacterium]